MSDADDLESLYDPDAFARRGHALVDALAEHLRGCTTDPRAAAMTWAEPEEQLSRWSADPPAVPEEGIVEFARRLAEGSVHQHSPRCIGYQVCPPVPVAALADLAASVLNNGMASYDSGPVSTVLERHVLSWMSRVLGLPEDSDGVMTSGGTLGNLTALLAARQAQLDEDAWNAGTDGRQLAVIVSEEAHYSIARAVGILGWGRGGAISVASDDTYRLGRAAIERGLARARELGRRVIAVVASAGTTPTGSFDRLDEIADVCREHALWLHVDGAHGAAAVLSPMHRDLASGIEHADSIVWDAHKMLGTPALCTAVLFRDGKRSYGTFEQSASYLFSPAAESPPWKNAATRTLECTKTMMSVKLYALLHTVGTDTMTALVERQFALGADLGRRLEAAADFDVPLPPPCNIVCFRYLPADVQDPNALQIAIRDRIVERGRFFIAKTTLRGQTYLRTTLMNPLTRGADLQELVETVTETGRAVLGGA